MKTTIKLKKLKEECKMFLCGLLLECLILSIYFVLLLKCLVSLFFGKKIRGDFFLSEAAADGFERESDGLKRESGGK